MNLSERYSVNDTKSYFISSEQAIFWLMEQKREKISSKVKGPAYGKEIYQGSYSRELSVTELLKWGGLVRTPKSKEEKAMLVAVLDEVFIKLPERTKVILILHFLGDFSSPEIYSKALQAQKVLKQKGKRVVLSYKYPKTRVAKILGVDRKTVTRHFQRACEVFDKKLYQSGFIS